MDKLLNDFTVHRPIGETWAVLTDVERIAPCLPGAQLQEIEGEIYRGVVKVKLGAISTAFKGQAKFVERDDERHVAVLHGEGRDTTGKGNADAHITARLEALDESTTKCVVETELHITGKVAQFGRGIMGDVSKKLIAQFAHNLNTMIEAGATVEATTEPATEDAAVPAAAAVAAVAATKEAPAAESPAPAAPSAEPATSQTAAAGTPAAETPAAETGSGPTVRKIEGPAAEPIELSNLAGGAVLKRALPLVGGLAILLLVVRWLRRR